MRQLYPRSGRRAGIHSVAARMIGCFLVLVLAACTGAAPTATPPPTATTEPTPAPRNVTLTMGSWRAEDVEQMNRILAEFTEQYPNITVNYAPTNASEYNAVLEAQLRDGTAPDVFYLRSYAVSRKLYQAGYLELLSDLPGLTDNFTPEVRAPWATDEGEPYGVPFIATAHGIYYNVDVFERLNIEIPTTWEALITAAETIREDGLVPFANASGDTWTIAEIVFMNIVPGFIGGLEGRNAYLNGERCFNDENMVAAFTAVQDLAPYLPENQGLLTYTDSLQLFLQGRASMWFGGSWDIPFFEAQDPDFRWSVFAVPAPEGKTGVMTFQLDAGMGLNAASQYKDEARLFLEWMTTQEFGAMLGNELPGFFPMLAEAPELNNEYANTFLQLRSERPTDVRFTWEKLMEGTPSAYDLVMNGAVDVVSGERTAQEAADALQNGLAEWYEPARTCQAS
jgi:raffinose/stachyose/melibiose transport system substrate-binding protein